jgi:hypothetical protein
VLPRAQPRWSAFEEPAVTSHLGVETYTWCVLTDPLKQEMLESVIREYQWVLEAFRQPH